MGLRVVPGDKLTAKHILMRRIALLSGWVFPFLLSTSVRAGTEVCAAGVVVRHAANLLMDVPGQMRITVLRYNAFVSLVVALMLSVCVPVARTDASSVTAVRVDTVMHGVKLSLSVPRRTYPRNALVTVTVRLENVSRRTVLVSGNNPSTVAVLDASHQAVYWPEMPFMGQELFDHSVPRRPTISLRPHHHLTRSYFVILRGPLLQAQATLGTPGKERDIRGTFVPLTLTEEAAPVARVSARPTVHATITPPAGVAGPLYFVEQTQCTGTNAVDGTWGGWGGASGDDLIPGFAPNCVSNRKWIAYAGWLNHPVVMVSYSEP